MSLLEFILNINDTIKGAIVGGLIGLLGIIAILIFEHHKWRKNLRVNYLTTYRNNLANLFSRIYFNLEQLATESLRTDDKCEINLPIAIHHDIEFLCPKEIRDSIKKEIKRKPPLDRSIKDREMNFRVILACISSDMGRYLEALDHEINKEINIDLAGKINLDIKRDHKI